MSKFKEFFVEFMGYQGSSGYGQYNPFSTTARYGFGEVDPISAPFQNEIPAGGYKSFGQWAQHHQMQTRQTRNFDLLEFVKQLGVPMDQARHTVQMFSTTSGLMNPNAQHGPQPQAQYPQQPPQQGASAGTPGGAVGSNNPNPQQPQQPQPAPEEELNGKILTYDGMAEYLRQLWNRTNAVTMTIGAPGTTPGGYNPERIEGAHFDGQGPHDEGTGQGNANPLVIRNIDKRVYIGEASGGPQAGSWQIGLAVYAIRQRDESVHQQFMSSYDPRISEKMGGKDLRKENTDRFDVFRENINSAIQLFNKWNYAYQKGLAYKGVAGNALDTAWQKMAGGTKYGTGLHHGLDAFN